MIDVKKIKSALISVYYKTHGLDKIVKRLHELGIIIYSTGGTADFIEGLGIPVIRVETLTGYPSILGGRVKTLHPKVFGGILARRAVPGDIETLTQYEIPEIDLVIVDLYPFKETVAAGGTYDEIIEKIDIGGISLIRGAAKNHADVVTVASKDQYKLLADILEKGDTSTIKQRKGLAAVAFNVTFIYDEAIAYYLKNSCTEN